MAAKLAFAAVGVEQRVKRGVSMGGRDSNYQKVYQGQELSRYVPGGWVMFQRRKEFGGGFWLGQTLPDMFMLGPACPLTEADAIKYMNQLESDRRRQETPTEFTPQIPLF